MSDRNTLNITVRLESPISYIDLPIKLDQNIRKLKIKSMFFQTVNVNSESLMVDVQGFNTNSVYLSNAGKTTRNYTLLLPLNKQAFAQNFYLNKSSTEEFDVIRKEPTSVPNLLITLYINNELRPTEITPLNPVIMELFLSS